MAGGEYGPAVGTALSDKEGLIRSEMTQDGQVINTASASLRELKTRLVLVRTKIAGLDREEATVDVTVRDQQAGGIEPRARGVAGHGDWMGNGGEAQPTDHTRGKMAFIKQEGLCLRT